MTNLPSMLALVAIAAQASNLPAASDHGWLLYTPGQQPVGRLLRQHGIDAASGLRTWSERTEVRRFLPGRYQLNIETFTWILDGALHGAGHWSRLAGERHSGGRWHVEEDGRLRLEIEGQAGRWLDIPSDWLPEPWLGEAVAHWLSGGATAPLHHSQLQPARARFVALELRLDPTRSATATILPMRLQARGAAAGEAVAASFEPARRQLLLPLLRHGQALVPRYCPAPCTVHLQPFDPLAALRVAAPFRMPPEALAGRVRYLLQDRDSAVQSIPATGEQQVLQQRQRTLLTICASCGDETPADAATLARHLQPNAWVQSDAVAIIDLLRTVPRSSVSDRPQALADFVRVHVDGRTELDGYVDAVTVARLRGGDCTEYAVLLAALLRADGYPARLVAGMVYSERQQGLPPHFVPHLWVQAWDQDRGRWRSLDAAAGPFGAGHVAMAIGDGSPATYGSVLALLQRLKVVAAAQLPSG